MLDPFSLPTPQFQQDSSNFFDEEEIALPVSMSFQTATVSSTHSSSSTFPEIIKMIYYSLIFKLTICLNN